MNLIDKFNNPTSRLYRSKLLLFDSGISFHLKWRKSFQGGLSRRKRPSPGWCSKMKRMAFAWAGRWSRCRLVARLQGSVTMSGWFWRRLRKYSRQGTCGLRKRNANSWLLRGASTDSGVRSGWGYSHCLPQSSSRTSSTWSSRIRRKKKPALKYRSWAHTTLIAWSHSCKLFCETIFMFLQFDMFVFVCVLSQL